MQLCELCMYLMLLIWEVILFGMNLIEKLCLVSFEDETLYMGECNTSKFLFIDFYLCTLFVMCIYIFTYHISDICVVNN